MRSFYSVAIDGGSVGAHTLRGAHLYPGTMYWFWVLIQLETITFNPGCLLDLGWAAAPTALLNGADPSFWSNTPPEIDAGPNYFPFAYIHNFGPPAPFQLTVNGASLTDGALVLNIISSKI
jgi:hypothetical protein